jgi:hypothetical protein
MTAVGVHFGDVFLILFLTNATFPDVYRKIGHAFDRADCRSHNQHARQL